MVEVSLAKLRGGWAPRLVLLTLVFVEVVHGTCIVFGVCDPAEVCSIVERARGQFRLLSPGKLSPACSQRDYTINKLPPEPPKQNSAFVVNAVTGCLDSASRNSPHHESF